MFNDPDAQPPFERRANFGFRIAQYPQPVPAALLGKIEQPMRDYTRERPKGEEAFRLYAGLYGYDKTPLDARTESVAEADRWRMERVSFNAAYRERMEALVFTPKTLPPPWQTVIFFPGSNALHIRSSADLNSMGLNAFSFLAKSGRAVVYPIYKSTYERGDGESDNQDISRNYRDHVLMWAQDLSRSLDYAATRRDLDLGRVAFYGISWGGALGPILAAVEPRIRAVVLISGGLEFEDTLPEVDPLNFAPHVLQPTLMINGRYDFFFPVETSQQPLFALLGAKASEAAHRLGRRALSAAGSLGERDRRLARSVPGAGAATPEQEGCPMRQKGRLSLETTVNGKRPTLAVLPGKGVVQAWVVAERLDSRPGDVAVVRSRHTGCRDGHVLSMAHS